jgi:NHLM bacteriocin system ABC transporter ATP-binding protein
MQGSGNQAQTGRRKKAAVKDTDAPSGRVPLLVASSDLFAAKGQTATYGGNEPFLLDQPAAVWIVQSGSVEVFASLTMAGADTTISQARHHVMSVEAGQALFGYTPLPNLVLLAVCAPDTSLTKLALADFREMANHPATAPVITGLLANWLMGLSEDTTKDLAPVQTAVLAEGEGVYSLEPRQKILSRKGGLWLVLESFASTTTLFLGEEPLLPVDGNQPLYFPLYNRAWLETESAITLTTHYLDNIIGEDAAWEGVAQFTEVFLRLKATTIALADFDEINRLRQKVQHDQAVEQKALGTLASVLEHRSPAQSESDPIPSGKNLLLTACRLVGQAQGVEIVAPPEYIGDKTEAGSPRRRDPLQEIVRSSRLNVRPVQLEPKWWQRDNGPLLGFSKTPVALLPVSSRAYELVNPADGSRRRVTSEVAASLRPQAYVFYRPLPHKALRVWDLLKFGFQNCRRDLLNLLLLSIGIGLLGLVVPMLTGLVVDAIIPTAERSLLWQVWWGLITVALTVAAFSVVRGIAVLRLETRLENSVQTALLGRLLGLEASFFRQYTAGDLATRVTGISMIRRLLSTSLTTTVLGSVTSLFSFFLLFSFDLGLALLALGLTLIALGVTLVTTLSQLPYQRRQLQVQGEIAGLVLQLITGLPKLRITGAERRAFGVWAYDFSRQRKLMFKARLISIGLLTFNAAWPLITALVIFMGVDLLRGRSLSTGSFLAFNAAFGQFLGAMLSMTAALTTVLQAVPMYERLKPILQTLPEISSDKAHPGALSGEIEVNNVSFRYSPEGPAVLDNISLQVKPGQFVAIVGPSGAGKSSLVRLLLGFEHPASGSIYYDGQDLERVDVTEVRRQIGVVTQNARLISGNIFHHIVGSLPYTLDEAWEAARLAGIEDDIRAMPMGMFTFIAEGGTTLSGGQRQRLLIAKAIVAKPRILIFDEATSALDNTTQALVSRSLESLQATRVVIAHRLSTIVNADVIYVLKDGKLTQSGTYNELIAQPGPFQELAQRQLA